MEKKQYNYTQLGMLFGIFIGGAIGVLLFVFTGNALYFTLTGLGLALGLVFGAGIDQQKRSSQD
jgi:hypothetical protein